CENGGYIVDNSIGKVLYEACDPHGENTTYTITENVGCENGGFIVENSIGEVLYEACYPPGENTTYTFTENEGCDNGGFIVTDSNSNQVFNVCFPSVKYGNTLFVDEIYGNDISAERENFVKPYKTIHAAIDDAQTGDLVFVRTGVYYENIVLKDGVDIKTESVLLNGKISDSGLTVKSNIYGNLKIKFVGNDALEIRGEMS